MDPWGLTPYGRAVTASMVDEHAAVVALLRNPPQAMGWPDLAAELVSTGSAVALWHQLMPLTLPYSSDVPDPLTEAAQAVAGWTDAGYHLVSIIDASYPERLRDIHQAPPVLFTRGRLLPRDRAVSVVGSRRASPHGIAVAEQIARGLVAREISVAAGLAAGIDTAAHRAALRAGGRTVAVIGTGINRSYPPENHDLHEEIASSGLLLSQFWPDAPPHKRNFIMRNATMSGYGVATIVVEAGEYSGSRSQARMAVEHGRPVILTIPVIESTNWARSLVGRPGVHVATDPQEALDIVDRLVADESTLGRVLDQHLP